MKITDIETFSDKTAQAYADPALAVELDALAASHSLLDTLQAARARLGVSFDEFAARMGVTPDELERIDSGTDADLSHNQIAAYVAALMPRPRRNPPARDFGRAAPPPRRKRTGVAAPVPA